MKGSMTSSLLPRSVPPMLASLAEGPFDSPDFRFEVKWDGLRCVAFLESATRLQSRHLNDLTGRYPDLADLHRAVAGQPAVLDGEIVVFSGGRPDFGALLARHHLTHPNRLRAACRTHPATYVAFDLLYWKGQNVMGYPLERRQALLAETIAETESLILSRPVDAGGVAYAEAVFARGLEGVMAKRRDSPYLPGRRSSAWLKVKRPRSLWAVLAGYIERVDGGPGSVVAALYDDAGRLRAAGLAGVSLPEAARQSLSDRLAALRRTTPPLAKVPSGLSSRKVRWVEPKLVFRLEYLERTAAGHLRHAVFRELVSKNPAACTDDQLEAPRPEGGDLG
ncbi:MAG TPA: ATP-dependent DNA ligase [Firmicutes bacterium]|nr:ATP-dependent DNA ligase [Bacillota bacterium]